MGFKVGIPVMKCSLNPSTQTHARTGKSSKTCDVGSAWREMNDERLGRDTTIDRSLTENNVWMVGKTSDDVEKLVQNKIDEINEERRDAGIRSLRKDAVSVIEIIEKPPIDHMQHLSYEEKVKLLSDSHDVMTDLLHEWNPNWQVIESVQHHDEFGGLSAHNHTLVLVSTEDKNGIATMNAKEETNKKFYSFINNNYADRMREKGYEVENCKTYDMLSEEEKEYRRQHPEEHGVDAYKYKQAKQEEMEKQLAELSNNVEEKKGELEQTKQELGDLQSEKADIEEREQALENRTREVEDKAREVEYREKTAMEAKENYDMKAAEYEEKVVALTDAPDLESYKTLLTENQDLKEELSLKDRIIDTLQEELDTWKERVEDLKEKVEDWKGRFHNFAQEAGQKIMGYFGYESEDQSISEYPSKDFADAFSSVKEDVSDIDYKTLRTIPDNEEEGKFRVVQRTDEGYETVMGGFDSRLEAESWQKDLASGVVSLNDSLDEGMSMHR